MSIPKRRTSRASTEIFPKRFFSFMIIFMTLSLKKFISLLIAWKLPILLGIIPLFFLPITIDYYDTNKWTIVVAIALTTLIIWGIRGLLKGRPSISISATTVALALFSLSALISTIIASPNKIEALTNVYGFVTFFALTLISLVPKDDAFRRHLRFAWFGMCGALSLISVYQLLGMGKLLFPSTGFLENSLWTPTGTTVATTLILILSLPLMIGDLASEIKKRRELPIAALSLLSLVVVGSAVALLWQIVPKLAETTLPLSAGWVIALEGLKNAVRAAVGTGAENFLFAFTQGRPSTLNMTPVWSTRFGANASFVLHIISIYGLVGLVGVLALFKALILPMRRRATIISRLLAVAALLFAPTSFMLLFTVVIILILTEESQKHMVVKYRVVGIVMAILGLLVGLALTYGLIRFYGGELLYYQSIASAQQNDGTTVYHKQIAAIRWNPFITRYHMTFSQTNLALANTLADAQTAENDTQKESDRQLIGSLIQQAIRESKLAVTISPQNVLTWENIGSTYQSLTNVAQGADEWAIGAYQNATTLDPTNPILRITLGNMFVQIGKYDDALREFQISANLKPDLANAYYNASNVYKLKGNMPEAIKAMEKTQSLIVPATGDYTKITGELEALRAMGSSTLK